MTLPARSETSIGHVQISNNADVERRVVAEFYLTSTLQNCTEEIVAGCLVRSACEPPSPTAVDAGKVTVSSPSIGNVELSMINGRGFLSQVGAMTANELVRVQGTGGAAVPPFDLTIEMPSVASEWSFGGCKGGTDCTVDSTNLTVTWTAATPRVVQFQLSTSSSAGVWEATCAFDKSPGRIPAEVYARMPVTPKVNVLFEHVAKSVSSGTPAHRTTVAANTYSKSLTYSFTRK